MIRPTTRVAWQAGISVALALLYIQLFVKDHQADHAYWITISVLFVVANTWGESIKRTVERITMTVLGGIFGTACYFFSVHDPVLQFLFLLGAIFFLSYFVSFSYAWCIFFITIIVVFVLAKMGDWGVHLLTLRISESLIGALIALAVSTVFLPVRGYRIVGDSHQNILSKVEILLDHILIQLKMPDHASQAQIKQWKDDIVEDFFSFRTQHEFLGYEFLLVPSKRALFFLFEAHLERLYYYLSNFLIAFLEEEKETLTVAHHYESELNALHQHLKYNFTQLNQLMNHKKADQLNNLSEWRAQLKMKISENIIKYGKDKEKTLKFYTLLYYLWRVNQAARSMAADLEKM